MQQYNNTKTFGYARVSSNGQNLEAQVQELEKHKCDEIFQEKLSGTGEDRPVFQALLKQLRAGDTLIVTHIDRLGRDNRHLINTLHILSEQHIKVKILELQAADYQSIEGSVLLGIYSLVADVTNRMRRERQRTGIALAKAQNKYSKKSRPKHPNTDICLQLYKEGYTCYRISKLLKMSVPWAYNIIKRHKQTKE